MSHMSECDTCLNVTHVNVFQSLCTMHSYSVGLFEKDKLVFSFMLCSEIMRTADEIENTEWNFFLRGAAGMETVSV